jgi:hypothetical protein
MTAVGGGTKLMNTNTNFGRAILWNGLTAGTLDITAACVTTALRGRGGPVGVFQSVASGVLGADSFQGGVPAAALGLVLHFVIAFGAAAVYVAASRRLRFLVEHPVVCGLLYGAVVYAFMNSVVVPLSAAPFKIPYNLLGLGIHLICVGLPIGLITARFSKTLGNG